MPWSTKRASACKIERATSAPSRSQRQPRQRNHGVAAPFAEPVIAREDRVRVRLAGDWPGNAKLRGGQHQLANPRRSVERGLRLRGDPQLERLFFQRRARVERRAAVERRVGIGAEHKRDRFPRSQARAENAGKKVVLAIVESPAAFGREIEIAVPLLPRLGLRRIAQQIKRRGILAAPPRPGPSGPAQCPCANRPRCVVAWKSR